MSMFTALAIANTTLRHLDRRAGFDEWWHGMDQDIQNEILFSLAEKVQNILELPTCNYSKYNQ